MIKKNVITKSPKTQKEKFTNVAKELKKMGITMAGLDVVSEKILEINVTSPCFFIKEINERFSTRIDKILNKFMLETSIKKQKALT